MDCIATPCGEPCNPSADCHRPTGRSSMPTRLTYILTLVVLSSVAAGQDRPAPAGEPPLPAGAAKRLGDTRLRPGARIKHLTFSPDGTRLASTGNWMYFEERLSVWDTAT